MPPVLLAAAGICAAALILAAGTMTTRVQAAPPPTPVPVTNRPAPTPVPPEPAKTPVVRPSTPQLPVQQPGLTTRPEPTFTPRIVYATVTPVPARPVTSSQPPASPNGSQQWRPAEGPPPAPSGPAASPTPLPQAAAPIATRTARPLTPVVSRQSSQAPLSGKAPLSFTPTGTAGGGGEAPVKQKVNEALMYFGVLSLAGAGSWGVYYLVRPPKD